MGSAVTMEFIVVRKIKSVWPMELARTMRRPTPKSIKVGPFDSVTFPVKMEHFVLMEAPAVHWLRDDSVVVRFPMPRVAVIICIVVLPIINVTLNEVDAREKCPFPSSPKLFVPMIRRVPMVKHVVGCHRENMDVVHSAMLFVAVMRSIVVLKVLNVTLNMVNVSVKCPFLGSSNNRPNRM